MRYEIQYLCCAVSSLAATAARIAGDLYFCFFSPEPEPQDTPQSPPLDRLSPALPPGITAAAASACYLRSRRSTPAVPFVQPVVMPVKAFESPEVKSFIIGKIPKNFVKPKPHESEKGVPEWVGF